MIYKPPVVLGITQLTSHQLEGKLLRPRGRSYTQSQTDSTLKSCPTYVIRNFSAKPGYPLLLSKTCKEKVHQFIQQGVLRVSFINALIPFMKTQFSWPNYLPRAPPPNTITLGVRLSTYKLGRGDKYPVYRSHGHRRNTAVHLKISCPFLRKTR